ncbi:hypothetical protein DVH24_026970 [Malus domestica]|uniref:Uncharacterized protein n=1 Tax=Malus domestica TaxID=3750 RepID=A0A498IRH4_MALDO|nr:hypothetical protein DVH24_026970 [Malus domestica]
MYHIPARVHHIPGPFHHRSTILSTFGLPFPHGFVFGNSRATSQWVTHPGSALTSFLLNFGVPTEPEASELLKGLMLGLRPVFLGTGLHGLAHREHRSFYSSDRSPHTTLDLDLGTKTKSKTRGVFLYLHVVVERLEMAGKSLDTHGSSEMGVPTPEFDSSQKPWKNTRYN